MIHESVHAQIRINDCKSIRGDSDKIRIASYQTLLSEVWECLRYNALKQTVYSQVFNLSLTTAQLLRSPYINIYSAYRNNTAPSTTALILKHCLCLKNMSLLSSLFLCFLFLFGAKIFIRSPKITFTFNTWRSRKGLKKH